MPLTGLSEDLAGKPECTPPVLAYFEKLLLLLCQGLTEQLRPHGGLTSYQR